MRERFKDMGINSSQEPQLLTLPVCVIIDYLCTRKKKWGESLVRDTILLQSKIVENKTAWYM